MNSNPYIVTCMSQGTPPPLAVISIIASVQQAVSLGYHLSIAQDMFALSPLPGGSRHALLPHSVIETVDRIQYYLNSSSRLLTQDDADPLRVRMLMDKLEYEAIPLLESMEQGGDGYDPPELWLLESAEQIARAFTALRQCLLTAQAR